MSPFEFVTMLYSLVFPLLAGWIVLGLVAELVLVEPSFHTGQVVRLVGVVILLALARVRSDRLHLVGLVALCALSFAFAGVVTPSLG